MSETRPWIRVHGLLTDVSIDAVKAMLRDLPAGAVGDYDEEVGAVVVKIYGGADLCNQVLRKLGQSGLVSGHPGTEESIIKYLPERASLPAHWDRLDDSAICTTCSWWTPPGIANRDELSKEMRRHTDRVHGGRVDSWD